MIEDYTQGAVRVLAPRAALTGEEAEALRDAAAKLPDAGRPLLVVDLASTPLIDSAGCEALLDARDTVAEAGGSVSIAGASSLSADILAATGVDREFVCYATVNEAVASFAR
ncbi:MAG: STAS domain-containing protein [Planctomycetota bacterium]